MFGSPEAFAGAAPDEAAQFALDACLWGEEGEETLGPSADGAKAAKAKLVEGNTLICSNLVLFQVLCFSFHRPFREFTVFFELTLGQLTAQKGRAGQIAGLINHSSDHMGFGRRLFRLAGRMEAGLGLA